MATTRTQITTYLSEDKHLDDWRLIKAHYGDQGDALVIRKMIEDFAKIIRGGGAGPPGSVQEEVAILRSEMLEVKRRLLQLENKTP